MSVLERCPSYRESKKGSKERQGPTLGVRFTGVHLIEVSVKRESTVCVKTNKMDKFNKKWALPLDSAP